MTMKRIVGDADQQTGQPGSAFWTQSASVDDFEGMSPGWALEWDLTTLSRRKANGERPTGDSPRTERGICGPDAE